MVWEVFEKIADNNGTKDWSLHIVPTGQPPQNGSSPFARGYWFYGKDGGDPAGKRSYEEACRNAKQEAERLNRLGKLPPQYGRHN